MSGPIVLGVSACLLGEQVRYDGGHQHDRYISDTLGRFFRFVAVCPEVGCGLAPPCEAMRLEGDPAAPRLMTVRTRLDMTERMLAYCRAKVVELLELIQQYHDQLVPLIVPLTLLKHYVNKYDQPYLKQQLYLSPHPAELMLRNHV